VKPTIIDIPGIGPAAQDTLAEHGIRTLRKLAGTSVTKLATVPGFSEARATKVIDAAADLLSSTVPAVAGTAPDDTGKKDKRGGKGKKDKKKKGKKDKKGGKGKKDKKNKKDKKKKGKK